MLAERDDTPSFWEKPLHNLKNSGRPVYLIFLDVDGVLNTSNETMATSISPHCLDLFCQLVIRVDAHIVVSSTWRKHKPFMDKLLSCLNKKDCGSRVIGKTEEIAPFERPSEILKWLRDAKSLYNLDVENWIAVDDMPLEEMSAGMNRHCVLTTIEKGFESHHLRQAEKLLRRSAQKQQNHFRTVTPTDS